MNNLQKEISFAGIAVIILLCTIFGANATAMKISLEGIGVFASSGIRFAIASIVLFLWAKATGRSLKIKKKYFKSVAIITIVFLIQFSCYILGVNTTTASRASLLINLQPFCVLILAHFFINGDRITIIKLIGMIVGFCGVASLFIFNGDISGEVESGDILILITAFLWGCNAVYFKTFIRNTSVFNVTFYHILLSVPFFFIESLIFDEVMIKAINPKIIYAILYQSVVCTAFGFIMWNSMLKRYKASVLHSFLFIMPVSGVFFGTTLLGEPLTLNIIIALFLIVSGIVIAQYRVKPIAKKVLPCHLLFTIL